MNWQFKCKLLQVATSCWLCLFPFCRTSGWACRWGTTSPSPRRCDHYVCPSLHCCPLPMGFGACAPILALVQPTADQGGEGGAPLHARQGPTPTLSFEQLSCHSVHDSPATLGLPSRRAAAAYHTSNTHLPLVALPSRQSHWTTSGATSILSSRQGRAGGCCCRAAGCRPP